MILMTTLYKYHHAYKIKNAYARSITKHLFNNLITLKHVNHEMKDEISKTHTRQYVDTLRGISCSRFCLG